MTRSGPAAYTPALATWEEKQVHCRNFVALICLAVLLLTPASAHAQSYPEKPITMVVPWPAGGSTDIAMRAISDAAAKQLNDARAELSIPDVDVVIGTGTDWREAVDNIAWESGDLLLLGSAAAGPMAQVFLGTAASKILRHAPVPVMIVPRHHTARTE